MNRVLYSGLFVTQEKGLIRFQLKWGTTKICLSSSAPYYQAQQKNLVAQKARGLMPKALPLRNWVKMAKFAVFPTKIAKFFVLLPDLAQQKVLFLTQ